MQNLVVQETLAVVMTKASLSTLSESDRHSLAAIADNPGASICLIEKLPMASDAVVVAEVGRFAYARSQRTQRMACSRSKWCTLWTIEKPSFSRRKINDFERPLWRDLYDQPVKGLVFTMLSNRHR
jgi:hypothetical protein